MRHQLDGNYVPDAGSMGTKTQKEVLSETNFLIKDLANFSGLKPHTIRTWEQRFDFLNGRRNDASRRLYTPQQVIHFMEVSLLRQNGYRMARIAVMNDDRRRFLIGNINGPLEYDRIIHDLICGLILIDNHRFNTILNDCVRKWGIHQTIESVITPFAERIGLLDDTERKTYRNNIYLVLECIKQKIYLAIDDLLPVAGTESKALLFLSGATTELPLLLLYYLLRRQGYKAIYLGEQFSYSELTTICRIAKPDYVITFSTGKYRQNTLKEFVVGLPKLLPETSFISTGERIPVGKDLPHYRHMEHLTDVMNAFNSSIAKA